MSDTFGTVIDPAAAPALGESVTDRLLNVVLAFCQAVLNDRLQVAWSAVCPGKQVVATVYPWDPEAQSFTDKDLPALFAHRIGGAKPPTVTADEWLIEEDTILLQWVYPSTAQARSRIRAPFFSGWSKHLVAALHDLRDPAYYDTSDADPLSKTWIADPDAILLSKATNASPQSYTGVGLDGAAGDDAIAPPRAVTVTLGGSAAAFVNGSIITVTGTNVLSMAVSRNLTVNTGAIPGTLATPFDFASVTGVSVGAQATGAGTIQVGTAARAGYGSPLLEAAGAIGITCIKPAQPRMIVIKLKGSNETKEYHAIEMQLAVRERFRRDPAKYVLLGDNGDTTLGAVNIVVTHAVDAQVLSGAILPNP